MPDSITLLFVYNLDSGVLESLHDYSTGRSTGKTACPLSAITHSPVGMKKEWKRFIKDLGITSRCLDRDQFSREFGSRSIAYPAVLVKRGTELSVLISADAVRQCQELGDLITLLKERLGTS
ncbi:MAG: hypothetical protein GYA23_02955 [Methanomicrobiales archaeon]|nr:hypothetical protein [Methanomicrobiales archaeon]